MPLSLISHLKKHSRNIEVGQRATFGRRIREGKSCRSGPQFVVLARAEAGESGRDHHQRMPAHLRGGRAAGRRQIALTSCAATHEHSGSSISGCSWVSLAGESGVTWANLRATDVPGGAHWSPTGACNSHLVLAVESVRRRAAARCRSEESKPPAPIEVCDAPQLSRGSCAADQETVA